MDYQEALDWIMSFWEVGRSKAEERAIRPLKVPRMRVLLERLGSPQLKFPSVLVAGTKGKGSTCAFVAEGLRAAGYRTGRYTQPHLIDWRERSWVDGCIISHDQVASLATQIRPVVEELNQEAVGLGALTTYEVGTAITLSYFADQQVDVAVLEIGVGGRLDALNALDPVLSILTSISYDHTDVLGNTLTEIAREKTGIFRPDRCAVTAPQQPEAADAVRGVAAEVGARLYEVGRDWTWEKGEAAALEYNAALQNPHPRCGAASASGRGEGPGTTSTSGRGAGPAQRFSVMGPFGRLRDLEIPLLGDHQLDNATVAVAALQLMQKAGLPVGDDAIRRGLARVEWLGRAQLAAENPRVVVDAAHNVDSAQRLLETVKASFPYRRLVLVFGASGDKNVAGMAGVLGPESSSVVVTGSGHRRAAELARLGDLFHPYVSVLMAEDPAEALKLAMGLAGAEDLVLVTGSVFLAGRAISILEGPGPRP